MHGQEELGGRTSATVAGRRCPRATKYADIAGGSTDIDGIKVMIKELFGEANEKT